MLTGRVLEEGEGSIERTLRGMVRRLGDALLHAHHGDLTLNYRDGDDVLRAQWKRDDA